MLQNQRFKSVVKEDIAAKQDGIADNQEAFVEQLSFPDMPAYLTLHAVEASAETASATENGEGIPDPAKSEQTSGSLNIPTRESLQERLEAQTGEISIPLVIPSTFKDRQTTARMPIIISATEGKSVGMPHPAKGRHVIVHAGVCIALLCIVFGALVAVLPANSQGHSDRFGILNPIMHMVTGQKNDTALIAAQAATATAVTRDGYEFNGAGGDHSFAGINTKITPVVARPPSVPQSPPAATGSGTVSDANFVNRFTPGQCTWWADYRYHQLTGYAAPWIGNARDWAYNAPAFSGWVVSSTPRVPSMIVLQPGVQYASVWGHVAIVEKINSDGSIYTSNYNVVGWGVLSYATYHAGPGVSFIYHI